MKRILFILSFFVTVAAFSQPVVGSDTKIHHSNSDLTIINSNEITIKTDTVAHKAGLVWANNQIYVGNGSYFQPLSQYAINSLVVKYADTSAMLFTYYNKTASDALRELKLNISDTASMLSPYLRSLNATGTYFPLSGGSLTGTGGAGFHGFVAQSSAPSTPASGFRLYADASNRLSWKGANGWVRTFDGTSNTGDRNYTLPDTSGRIAMDFYAAHLAGTETFTGAKTFSPSVTASSAIARGVNITPTLVAAANNDVLVGLDLNPTFTNGAFTGVRNLGIRLTGDMVFTGNNNIWFNGYQFGAYINSNGYSILNYLRQTGYPFRVGVSGSTQRMDFTPTTTTNWDLVVQGDASSNANLTFKNGPTALGVIFGATNNFVWNSTTDIGHKLSVTGGIKTDTLLVNQSTNNGTDLFQLAGSSSFNGITKIIGTSSQFNVDNLSDGYQAVLYSARTNFYGSGVNGSALTFGSIYGSIGVNKSALGTIPANSLVLTGGSTSNTGTYIIGYTSSPLISVINNSSSINHLELNGGYTAGTDISVGSPAHMKIIAPLGSGTGTAGDIIFYKGVSGTTGTALNTTSEIMRIKSVTESIIIGSGGGTAHNGFPILDVTGKGYFSDSLQANYYKKIGGTSSQILAANGSVITAGSNITISGGTISSTGGGSYLPLSGGTLTGSMNGTSATFSSTVTATGFFESSDARLKNIIFRNGDMVSFQWKRGFDKKTHYGYIAQEVQKYMPNAVKADGDGLLSVDYIQVLVKKVNDLENIIKSLNK